MYQTVRRVHTVRIRTTSLQLSKRRPGPDESAAGFFYNPLYMVYVNTHFEDCNLGKVFQRVFYWVMLKL